MQPKKKIRDGKEDVPNLPPSRIAYMIMLTFQPGFFNARLSAPIIPRTVSLPPSTIIPAAVAWILDRPETFLGLLYPPMD